jgi:hypothetical protein
MWQPSRASSHNTWTVIAQPTQALRRQPRVAGERWASHLFVDRRKAGAGRRRRDPAPGTPHRRAADFPKGEGYAERPMPAPRASTSANTIASTLAQRPTAALTRDTTTPPDKDGRRYPGDPLRKPERCAGLDRRRRPRSRWSGSRRAAAYGRQFRAARLEADHQTSRAAELAHTAHRCEWPGSQPTSWREHPGQFRT